MEKSPLEKLREMQSVNTQEVSGSASQKSSNNKSIITGIGIALLFLITKLKYLAIFAKFIPTALTMGASLLIYAQFYGWKFALGFLLLILVHEAGHGFAAKIMGLKVGVPIFIPFFGAFIALKEQPRSTFVEAVVGFGGPFAGLIGATAVFCFGYFNENVAIKDFCMALAWVTAMINYFNLMPFFGLDGDRISQPMKTSHWVVLIVLVSGLIYWYYEKTTHVHPFMLFLMLGALIKGFRVWKKSSGNSPEKLIDKLKSGNLYTDEEKIGNSHRLQSLLAYLFLASTLTALMIVTELLRVKHN